MYLIEAWTLVDSDILAQIICAIGPIMGLLLAVVVGLDNLTLVTDWDEVERNLTDDEFDNTEPPILDLDEAPEFNIHAWWAKWGTEMDMTRHEWAEGIEAVLLYETPEPEFTVEAIGDWGKYDLRHKSIKLVGDRDEFEQLMFESFSARVDATAASLSAAAFLERKQGEREARWSESDQCWV